MSDGNVTVHVEQKVGTKQCCPTCGEISPGYDRRKRTRRHLDTCQYKTILVLDKPKLECKEASVSSIS
ncbi:MAG: transposase family protein [Candidatus Thiodiazotropha sp. (ex Lucinoma aequizonata)]|nr:transposase family protein [Candidatus Thiodiazotropha sp. (ex Lucinoma aequizonata)]MCU7895242.1 transposase family protein [Candidatus Thiodiazotropha sp. (ex Lucinoma aequizonata)]MCU7900477.1 transposase family protein [Candidatus Thiodiazotropha sp. (ex Lucinoma aequizonata)]MCU7902710.1 transposase family protein [Candidatus Thiodiazotropha sp. (ex Lucinoma aequizonata)]MCU7907402.1 transposase family protein [Candidatus Thiodiazotropha sp. (ex Lucinoma aequizonata)]